MHIKALGYIGGIGMGKTCEPKAFSFKCMTKFTTKKKKKKALGYIKVTVRKYDTFFLVLY